MFVLFVLLLLFKYVANDNWKRLQLGQHAIKTRETPLLKLPFWFCAIPCNSSVHWGSSWESTTFPVYPKKRGSSYISNNIADGPTPIEQIIKELFLYNTFSNWLQTLVWSCSSFLPARFRKCSAKSQKFRKI